MRIDLIRSNTLQVGGLLASNAWVYGDVMDLEIRRQESEVRGQETVQALVTVYGRPLKTYLLLASTNFFDWIPVATNTPAGSRFDYLDTFGSAGGSPAPFGVSPNGIPNGLDDLPGGPPGNAGQRPALPQRFFRAVMLEHLYDSFGISLEEVGRGGTRSLRAFVKP